MAIDLFEHMPKRANHKIAGVCAL